eukprot:9400364-Pyramimonas_sp.AAC.1
MGLSRSSVSPCGDLFLNYASERFPMDVNGAFGVQCEPMWGSIPKLCPREVPLETATRSSPNGPQRLPIGPQGAPEKQLHASLTQPLSRRAAALARWLDSPQAVG